MFADISLNWKILLLAVIGPVVIAVILATQQVILLQENGEQDVINQSRAVVLMSEAARDEMSKKLSMGIIKPFDQLDSREKRVEAVPIITAINMAKRNAEKLDYVLRVPKVSPRNPENKPTPLELSVLEEMKSKGLDERIIRDSDSVRYFRAIRLTEDCLYCHGDPKGEKDPVGGIKEGWKVGEIHGAFEIIASLDKAQAQIQRTELYTVGETIVLLLALGALVAFLVRRTIVGPLFNIRDFAQSVASGDLGARPKGTFSAELAVVKDSIASMVDNLKMKMNEAETQKSEAEAAKAEAENAMEEARVQEAKSVALLEKMRRVANEAAIIAEQVTQEADQLSNQAALVTQGADVQRDRTTQTATAMEEMNATVLEVAKNSASSADSASKARNQAQEGAEIVRKAITAIREVHTLTATLKQSMAQLGTRTTDIGQIMNVIDDIADQTNLLALNAAIEAARAGEAGRGFAVVADEVRKLAEKTMQATKEVGEAIKVIQDGASENIHSVENAAHAVDEATEMANRSGESLESIVLFADDTSAQVQSIAAAAEQQSAASEEINQAVEDINQIANETAEGMNESVRSITELAKLAGELRELIDEMNE